MLRPLIMDRWVCTLSLSSEWSDGLKLKLCLRSYPNRSEFRFHELITKSDSRLTAASHLERRELAVYSIYYRSHTPLPKKEGKGPLPRTQDQLLRTEGAVASFVDGKSPWLSKRLSFPDPRLRPFFP